MTILIREETKFDNGDSSVHIREVDEHEFLHYLRHVDDTDVKTSILESPLWRGVTPEEAELAAAHLEGFQAGFEFKVREHAYDREQYLLTDDLYKRIPESRVARNRLLEMLQSVIAQEKG